MDLSSKSFTKSQTLIDEIDKNCKDIEYAQERAIEWFASKDMLYWDQDDMGVVKRPSARKLAEELGISRQTIYNWRKTIPDIKIRMREARLQIEQINITAVWNGVFLKACDGDPKAAEMYLSYFSDYRPPTQSNFTQEVNGIGDLFNLTRNKIANN
jgi:hypothetical protein